LSSPEVPVSGSGPALTCDIIIQLDGDPDRIVLVRRRNPPHGWALPGGFVDRGETVEDAAAREALEETGLAVESMRQFHTYSDPGRDPRGHTVSVVFVGRASGIPRGADDALEARVFRRNALPADIVFDHRDILADFFKNRY
jgi:8-oxo-dGTP diphosphatase